MQINIHSSHQMEQLGAQLADCLAPPAVVFLHGDLGAGKTTLVRGLLRALQWREAVKSPTYTLVESYSLKGIQYHHFDLYRIRTPSEVEWLGLDSYLTDTAICLFEWPERAEGYLRPADLDLTLRYTDSGRTVQINATNSKLSAAISRLLDQWPEATTEQIL